MSHIQIVIHMISICLFQTGTVKKNHACPVEGFSLVRDEAGLRWLVPPTSNQQSKSLIPFFSLYLYLVFMFAYVWLWLV